MFECSRFISYTLRIYRPERHTSFNVCISKATLTGFRTRPISNRISAELNTIQPLHHIINAFTLENTSRLPHSGNQLTCMQHITALAMSTTTARVYVRYGVVAASAHPPLSHSPASACSIKYVQHVRINGVGQISPRLFSTKLQGEKPIPLTVTF